MNCELVDVIVIVTVSVGVLEDFALGTHFDLSFLYEFALMMGCCTEELRFNNLFLTHRNPRLFVTSQVCVDTMLSHVMN